MRILEILRSRLPPNLPKAIREELKALVDAGMEISQETLMSLASFIEDVQAEMERINARKGEDQEDVVMRHMFGRCGQMDSQTYWRNRETEQRKHDIKDEQEYRKHIEEIYQNMIDEIEKEINGFYGKYARKRALRWQKPEAGRQTGYRGIWPEGGEVCEGEKFLQAGQCGDAAVQSDHESEPPRTPERHR